MSTTLTYPVRFRSNNSSFNGDVYRVDFLYETVVLDTVNRHCNVIRYYDVNENYLEIIFLNYEGYNSINNFNDRTYYLQPELSDNQSYNQGYNQGLLDNQSNIYNQGYNAGSSAGYGQGYSEGIEDGSDYSFFSLFGAVLDAPISALKGLLNFQIFGVNLLTLFTGLLTLAIILLVLKLMRGGK